MMAPSALLYIGLPATFALDRAPKGGSLSVSSMAINILTSHLRD